MSEKPTTMGRWEPGESGNPNGRPPNSRALSAILRSRGSEPFVIGEDGLTRQEAIAEAIWKLVLTGEVYLSGTLIRVKDVNEWLQVVKWVYSTVDLPKPGDPPEETVVRVVRVDRQPKPHVSLFEEQTEE